MNYEGSTTICFNLSIDCLITWQIRCSSGILSKSSPNLDGDSGHRDRAYVCRHCSNLSWDSRTLSPSRSSSTSTHVNYWLISNCQVSCVKKRFSTNSPEDMRMITFSAAYSTVSSRSLLKLSAKWIILVMHWFPCASPSFRVSRSLILMCPCGIGIDR